MAVKTYLKEARLARGLTQKQVADDLLISKDSLSRYERGEQDPRLEIAMRLSKYFGIAMEKLYEIRDWREV